MSEGDNNTSVYIYNGVDEVPEDVAHVRVDPSVTVIPANTFRNRQKLEEVELPEGLVQIEERAFYICQSLKIINFPSTVKEIEDYSFHSCEKLEVIILPEGLQVLKQYAFFKCQSLKSINIPPNIKTIERATFLACYNLTDVILPEGLREMKRDAFSRCTCLESITIPSSLKVIGEESFEGCKLLNEIHMHDTIESIETGAFKGCNITRFRIPPLMTTFHMGVVGGNTSLVSLELPEIAEQLDDNCNGTNEHHIDLNVRNIAFPLECVIDTSASDALRNCTDLGLAFPDTDDDDDNDTTITAALKTRFDDLPIHKLCYYQSYHNNETTMQHLKRATNPWTTRPPGRLNTTGKEQDCLGMTPLHILACSTKPTIEMFQILIDKYPESLIMKDKWGDVPLLYAIWCNAQAEVVDLLVESYKSLYPDYEFDWKGMLLILAKRNVPLGNIQRLINTQQKSFPEQEYDMQALVIDLAAYDASYGRSSTSVETFRYLLQVSTAKRLGSLAVGRWKAELENVINSRLKIAKSRDKDTEAVYDRLAIYESIKEGTSVLELALWKAKIDEGRNKRARVDSGVSYRDQCRINCRAELLLGMFCRISYRNHYSRILSTECSSDNSDSDDGIQ